MATLYKKQKGYAMKTIYLLIPLACSIAIIQGQYGSYGTQQTYTTKAQTFATQTGYGTTQHGLQEPAYGSQPVFGKPQSYGPTAFGQQPVMQPQVAPTPQAPTRTELEKKLIELGKTDKDKTIMQTGITMISCAFPPKEVDAVIAKAQSNKYIQQAFIDLGTLAVRNMESAKKEK